MGQFLAPKITTASRSTLTLSASELVYDTDLSRFFGGDGTTAGGFAVGNGTVTSITASSPLTGGTITGSGTIGIQQASNFQAGYISASDYRQIAKISSSVGSISLNSAGGNARIGTSNLSADKNLTITVYDEDAIKITTDVSAGPTVIDIAPGYTPGITSTLLNYNGELFLSLTGISTGTPPSISILSNNLDLNAIGDISIYASSFKYSNGTNYVGFQLPTLSADSLYTLPVAIPTSNKVLQSDSSGVLSWVTMSGGGTTYTFSTGLTNTSGTVTSNLSTGVAGGQTVIGGTAVSDNLTLSSTSDPTKGKIILGTLSAYDELNDRLGIGTTNPTGKVNIVNGTASQIGLSITSSSTTSSAFALTHSTSVTTGILQGAQIIMNLNPTASSAANNRSLYMTAQLNSANGSAFTGNPVAGWFECRVLQAGAITRLTAGTFYGAFIPASGVTGTINVALAEGLFVTVAYSGQPGLTGTITAARGMYITQSNVSASSVTVTSQVGIIMDAMTTATISNSHIVIGQSNIPSGNWGIYSSTSNASYFAGNLLLGTTSNAGYRLDVSGLGRFTGNLVTTGRVQATVAKSAAYTLTNTDRIVFVTASSGYNITLPTASTGQEYTIVKTDATANTITINTTGGAKINGATTYTGLSAQYKHITVVFNGTDWFITSSN